MKSLPGVFDFRAFVHFSESSGFFLSLLRGIPGFQFGSFGDGAGPEELRTISFA